MPRSDQSPCSRCGAAADGACPRCGALLCLEHLPAADRRCEECEAEYVRLADHIDDRSLAPHVIVATLVCALAAVAVGLGWGALAVVGAGALAAKLTGWRADRAADRDLRALRQSFLAEQPRLPPSDR